MVNRVPQVQSARADRLAHRGFLGYPERRYQQLTTASCCLLLFFYYAPWLSLFLSVYLSMSVTVCTSLSISRFLSLDFYLDLGDVSLLTSS